MTIELTRIGQILQNMPCYRYNNTMHSCIIDEEKHIICLKALFLRFCCNPLLVLATTLYSIFYVLCFFIRCIGFCNYFYLFMFYVHFIRFDVFYLLYLKYYETTIHRKDVIGIQLILYLTLSFCFLSFQL